MQLLENFKNVTIAELPQLAENIIQFFDKRNIICLQGEIGAGKTTLTKQIVKKIIGDDKAISPTFSILNIYTNGKENIYHLDLYRLNNKKEFFDLGLYEYLADNKILIEWPELILDYLENYEFYLVKISIISETQRNIEIWG
ncbi:MAG: tRNA (adenosine(37)-N6)-threonylcarbamoyltransferase complex ATPase subunit type 1 TsaE [Bacteroidales bacterium]|jgi:tRNA threonylcarbamoyladenosine biosynthesis protein TsaE|nr:tRNA (adenosine(37)-N6)-threonylcarbamoyltransferase complex ATPase subunit type 1 TsaE [Bacteroidales bacterium]